MTLRSAAKLFRSPRHNSPRRPERWDLQVIRGRDYVGGIRVRAVAASGEIVSGVSPTGVAFGKPVNSATTGAAIAAEVAAIARRTIEVPRTVNREPGLRRGAVRATGEECNHLEGLRASTILSPRQPTSATPSMPPHSTAENTVTRLVRTREKNPPHDGPSPCLLNDPVPVLCLGTSLAILLGRAGPAIKICPVHVL